MKVTSKIISFALCATMLMSVAVPAFAASDAVNSVGSVAADVTNETKVGQDITQGKQSEYYAEFDTDATDVPVEVYATQASGSDIVDPDTGEVIDGSIGIIIPKTIVVDGASAQANKAAYTVQVKGNIAGDEIITVAPDATFKMSQTGKTDIDATVTQATQKFAVPTSLDATLGLAKTVTTDYADSTVTGEIAVKGLTAGSWHGSFNFDISID